ncbi:MAG: DUF1559 domain-containing protein [Planctomycetia bacterium]|nr:DUF1559 domain-containing protein [Planctomycetia bacterium]
MVKHSPYQAGAIHPSFAQLVHSSARSSEDGFWVRRLGSHKHGILIRTSQTIAIAEDSGRNYETVAPFTASKYPDPIGVNAADPLPPSGNRAIDRWAEPDTGNGVSGPPNSTVGDLRGVINNNAVGISGPPDCPWSTNNCGPNDEIFSFHPGGALALFVDGSVHFLAEGIDPRVMRKLVTRDEGAIIANGDWQPYRL